DGFHRHAGAGPGRGIARRDLAGIGERGFLRGLSLAVDDRYFMAGARQIIGRGDANDATAENDCLHDPSRIRRGIIPRLLESGSDSIGAGLQVFVWTRFLYANRYPLRSKTLWLPYEQ